MFPPFPNNSKFIDKYPEQGTSNENISDQQKQENYEAEVNVYRALENLDIEAVVLHGLNYTNRQYALFIPEFQYDEKNPNRVTGECDFVVLGKGFVLIIEVSDIREDSSKSSNKGIRRTFNQKKKQGERTEKLVREMLKQFDGNADNFPDIRWYFACPSLSKSAVKYTEDEMSRIIFREEILPIHEGSTPSPFMLWWENNLKINHFLTSI